MNAVNKYLQRHGLVRHHIESFDWFIHHGLATAVGEESTVSVAVVGENDDGAPATVRVTFSNPVFSGPTRPDGTTGVLPAQCRQYDWTYEGHVEVDITVTTLDAHGRVLSERTVEAHKLCALPVMLGSTKCTVGEAVRAGDSERLTAAGECRYEMGGYFILRGKERVLVPQERMAYNLPLATRAGAATVVDTRNISLETNHSVLVQAVLDGTSMMFGVPYMCTKVPVVIMLMAYMAFLAPGLVPADPLAMCRTLLMPTDEYAATLAPAVRAAWDDIVQRLTNPKWRSELLFVRTPQDALAWLARKRTQSGSGQGPPLGDNDLAAVRQVMLLETFPHLGIVAQPVQCIAQVVVIATRLIAIHVGAQGVDSRDHLANKRIESPGMLMYDLFRTVFKRFVRNLATLLNKQKTAAAVLDPLPSIVRCCTITKDIRFCFLTGTWVCCFLASPLVKLPHCVC